MRVFVLAVIALAVSVPTAHACSCASSTTDPREDLADADAALYGRVVARRQKPSKGATGGGPVPTGGLVRYRIRVAEDYKGNLGRKVTVRTQSEPSACGLDLRRGDRIALFLGREGGHWTSSLCAVTTRARLRAGARPLPSPDGVAPQRYLAYGYFGEPAAAGLDAAGRVLGYATDTADAFAYDVCPGGRAVLEFAEEDFGYRYTVRTRATDGVAAGPSATVDLEPWYAEPEQVDCRSEDGSQAAILTDNRVLLHLENGTLTEVRRQVADGLLDGGRVWTRKAVIDAVTGARTPFGPLPRKSGAVSLSPGATSLAVAAPPRLLIYDTATGTEAGRATFTPWLAPAWLGEDVVAAANAERTVVLDRTGAELARIQATFTSLVADGAELIALRPGRRAIERYDTTGRRTARLPLFSRWVRTVVPCPSPPPARAATGPAR